MNNQAKAQEVRAAVKSKFRGHKVLKSKVVTHFPANLSREYERITNAYLALLNKTLADHLPSIRRAIDGERNRKTRHDADNDVHSLISQTFMKIQREFEGRTEGFGLEKKLDNLARLSRKLSIREWKRVVHRTLGIDITEDYYMGEFYRETLKQWTRKNADLIKTIPRDTLTDMRNIVQEGYIAGRSNTSIGRDIQTTYGVQRRHAQFLARDQIAKLNADLTKSQQQDAGVEEYVWSDSDDGRVRLCHNALDGTRHRWDDPPEMWYMTKKRGKVMTGRRCHPGEDYDCRCVALPVFDLPGLKLPWEKGEGK